MNLQGKVGKNNMLLKSREKETNCEKLGSDYVCVLQVNKNGQEVMGMWGKGERGSICVDEIKGREGEGIRKKKV